MTTDDYASRVDWDAADTDDMPQDVRDAIDDAWQMEVTDEQRRVIDELFYQKLAALDPNHPWVRRWQERKRQDSL